MIANIVYMIIAISCIEISSDLNFSVSLRSAAIGSFLAVFLYVTLLKIMASSLISRMDKQKDSTRVQEFYNRSSTLFTMIAILALCLHLLFYNSCISAFKDINTTLFYFTRKVYGLFIFFLYLSIFWHSFSRVYNRAFGSNYTPKSFVKQNLRFYLPISLPYLLIIICELFSSIFSLSRYLPSWINTNSWVFSFLIAILFFVLLPPLVLSLWGCKRLASDRIKQLERFLTKNGFSYNGIYSWPIFEGKILTAGIVGPLPWMRYILVTESIVDALTDEELKAVMAHEMGHAKLKHMWLYLLLLFSFSSLLWFCHDIIIFFVFRLIGFFDPYLFVEGSKVIEVVTVLIYLLLIFFFLRFIFGYFMRNFERQADLFAARLAGTENIINSLEKIAFFSGRAKDLPSWHHFSISQRIDAIRMLEKDPTYYRSHNKKLLISFALFFLFFAVIFYAKQGFNLTEAFLLDYYEKVIEKELRKIPHNSKLLLALAQIAHEKGDENKAKALYEQVLLQDPNDSTALNNLAWLILTKKESQFDISRALEMAKKAVEIERNPAFLDTLAEAYFATGDISEAIKYQEEAFKLSRGTKYEEAFKEKLMRFQKALETKSKPTQ